MVLLPREVDVAEAISKLLQKDRKAKGRRSSLRDLNGTFRSDNTFTMRSRAIPRG
jgi:hypothetical protein